MNILATVRAALQTIILFSVGLFVPLIGQAAALFTPVPLIIAALRWGHREALAALAAASLAAGLLAGPQAGVILVLGFGTMAAGISFGMRKGLRQEQTVLLGGLLPAATAAALLYFSTRHAGGGLLEPAEKYIRESIRHAAAIYQNAGLRDMAEAVNAVSDRFVYYFVRLLPGLALFLSLAQAAACLGVARAFLLRNPGAQATLPAQPPFAAWHAPDTWVWGLIASLGCIAAPQEIVRFLGLNFGILFLLLYTAQGMAIVDHYLKKGGLGALPRILIQALLLALPSVMLLPALGVVDIWSDFRKVRKQEENNADSKQ